MVGLAACLLAGRKGSILLRRANRPLVQYLLLSLMIGVAGVAAQRTSAQQQQIGIAQVTANAVVQDSANKSGQAATLNELLNSLNQSLTSAFEQTNKFRIVLKRDLTLNGQWISASTLHDVQGMDALPATSKGMEYLVVGSITRFKLDTGHTFIAQREVHADYRMVQADMIVTIHDAISGELVKTIEIPPVEANDLVNVLASYGIDTPDASNVSLMDVVANQMVQKTVNAVVDYLRPNGQLRSHVRRLSQPTNQELAEIQAANDSLSKATARAEQSAKAIVAIRQSVDARATTVLSALAKSNQEYRDKLQRVAELQKAMDAVNHDAALAESWMEAQSAVRKMEKDALVADSEYSRLSLQLKDAIAAKAVASADVTKAANQLEQVKAAVAKSVVQREAQQRNDRVVSKGMARSDVEALWGSPSSSESASSGQMTCTYDEYDSHSDKTVELRAVYIKGVLVDFDTTRKNSAP